MSKIFTNIEDPNNSFVAYETGEENTVIASGDEVNEVIKKAEETGKEFILSFVPKDNQSYIF